MAAHRADLGARLADVAAQQLQIDQHLHVLHARHVLGQAHAVNRQDPVGRGVDAGEVLDVAALQARIALDVLPARRLAPVVEGLEALGVLEDEVVVEDLAAGLGRRGRLHREASVILGLGQQLLAVSGVGAGLGVHLDQRLADAGEQGDVAAVTHLQDLAGDFGLRRRQHLGRILRILEPLQPPLLQGVDADHFGPAVHRFLQLVQDARRGRARVVGHVEDQVGLFEVLQRGGAHRDADALRQGHRGALVAHVGAVGQVVGPVDPRQQLVHVAGFQAGPAGGVEHCGVGVRAQGPELPADAGEGLFPRYRDVFVRGRVPAQWMGQPAGGLQLVVGPGVELGQGVLFEEALVGPVTGDLPGGRLHPVLADLQGMRHGRFAPGAADAHVTVGLVLVQDDLGPLDGDPLAHQDVGDRRHRSVSAGRLVIRLDLRVALLSSHDQPSCLQAAAS